VPSASNIRRYAEIVRERSILRKLVTASDEIATNAFNPQGKAVDQDPGRGRAEDLQHRRRRLAHEAGLPVMDSLVVNLLDRVQEMADNPNDVTGVPTGFYDLDRMTSGLQAGDMIVLAARPSMGKTAFAINIAEHVALNEGLPVAISRWKWARRSWPCVSWARSAALTRAPAHRQADRRRVAAPDRGHRKAAHGLAAHRRNARPDDQ
jgi:replicative DNA helicase